MNNMMSFVPSLGIFVLAMVFTTSNAAESPAELYWKSKLGNITIPKVLKDSLQQGLNDEIVKLDRKFKLPQVHGAGADLTYVWGSLGDYAHTDYDQVAEDGRVLFFTDKKLTMVGVKMKLLFKQIHNNATFLPSYFTKSMDFSSTNLQLILNKLSVNPKSIAAKQIQRMLNFCAQKAIKGEVRYCATSLEDIVDYVTLNLKEEKNKRMQLVSTQGENDILMEYTILEARFIGNDDNHTLVCHKMFNPYVVFLCHNIRSTDVYGVSLVDANGKQIKAVAVCHKDTSFWNPGHLAFKILKVKPGDKHICHFISGDTIVWFRNEIPK